LDDVVEYSSLFVASRVFAVLASVWGGLAFAGLLLVVCSCLARWTHRARSLAFSALCLLAATCQGLSFLLLDSDMCQVVYANQYAEVEVNASAAVNITAAAANVSTSVPPPSSDGGGGGGAPPDEWVEAVSCRPSVGMRLAMAAIVLYCASALLALRAVPVTISSDPFHHVLSVESDDGSAGAGKDDDDGPPADSSGAAPSRGIDDGGTIPERSEGDGGEAATLDAIALPATNDDLSPRVRE
jgi:hypothetical protein